MKKENRKNLFEYYQFTKKDERDYPVVSRILKQLTPERIKREVESIQKIELPSNLQKWVREYSKIGKRNLFFWQWIYKAIQETAFPMISSSYREPKYSSEFLLTMFIIILDDAVDNEKNKTLLNGLAKIYLIDQRINFRYFNYAKNEHLIFITKILYSIRQIIKKFPRYGEFKDIFNYDVRQIINAMLYYYLVNTNHYLINKSEYWLYSPHTLQIVATTMLDLMCIPEFDIQEIGLARQAALEAQKMARIGNCLCTLEREIEEKDFTNGIFAYALDSSIIDYCELEDKYLSKIYYKIKKSSVEKKILLDWLNYYFQISKFCKKIKSIKVNDFLFGSKKLLTMYLSARKKI